MSAWNGGDKAPDELQVSEPGDKPPGEQVGQPGPPPMRGKVLAAVVASVP